MPSRAGDRQFARRPSGNDCDRCDLLAGPLCHRDQVSEGIFGCIEGIDGQQMAYSSLFWNSSNKAESSCPVASKRIKS